MKPHPDPDPELHRLLQHWQVDGALSPRFTDRVWQRLAHANPAPVPQASLAGLLAAWLHPFTRPAVAATYLVLLLLAGSGAGWRQGLAQARQLDAQMARQYVQSVSPDITTPP